MFFLDVTGPEGGRTVAFPTAELSIGSGPDCDLQLIGPGVAPHHASLIERDRRAYLLDLGTSTIAVNGQRVVEMVALLEGSIVTIGPFQLRFREVDLPPDTVQTQTLRQPSAPPIPMSLRDIEILSVPPSTSNVVRSSELITDEEAEHAETDPSIPAALPLPPDDQGPDDVSVKTPHHPSAGRDWRGPPSSLHATEDPIEVEFLRAIDEEADVDAARIVYADWLEERGDKVRADYVRTLEKVVAGSDKHARGHLRRLGGRISNAWRAMMLPRSTPIERCAAPPGGPVAGACPRTWGALERMGVDDVRRCTVCSTFVHYVPDVKAEWRFRPVVIDLAEERRPGDLAPPLPPAVYRRPRNPVGRRTSRVDLAPSTAASSSGPAIVAEYYADCARLESLAVTAFAHLYDDLTALGAPVSLRRRALDASREETEHVQLMEALAGRPSSWLPGWNASSAVQRRAAFEVARENAVEGCVRETYGALVARHHAARATTETAGAMAKIAIDEHAHASLSWDVARWLEPRLTAQERRELAEARVRAIDELLEEAVRPVDPALVAGAGCPDEAAALAMVRAVARQVEAFDARSPSTTD